MVQKRNIIVKALANPDMALIINATFDTSPPANIEKKRVSIMNKGAPGGCPTCNLKALAINSPQSQRLVVGSRVRKYMDAAIINKLQPKILL